MSIIKWNAASVYCKAGILIGTILMLTGCAVEPHRGLEEARQNLNRAKQDQVIADNAPVALYDAEKTITKAENAWMEDDDEDYANHMAYMANQQIKIAEEKARQKAAQLEFSRLSDETQQLQLQARTRELEALKAQKTDRGMLITMGDVLFETGKADLKSGALQNLYRLATFLRENPSRNVLIEGHTDSVGSKQNNQLLSERRAHSVATFLMNNGVDSTRITDVGYGEDFPVDTNSTPAGRRNNRRVEVIVLNEGEPPRLRR
ncbi:MAG: OmpA family protein [Methylobacter sp.]|uniref:OmpA family protein n=1 Tax=Methylobacter sp. TaxID=2051955 RepID=UPI00258EF879|nr:OmpA family protein [Methylobacter sp.]MCL7420215.1 OmpA family protein [Methylobacter sp.]